jgi:putative sigma-54 modulation protein
MKINLRAVNFKASEQLKEFIDEKVGKLFNFSNDIISAEVTLTANDIKIPNNKVCEIRLVVPGYDDFVKKEAQSFEEAILNAVEVLQKVLRRKKGK